MTGGYLCAINDVCSTGIVGYSINSRMKSCWPPSPRPTRQPADCVLHTDWGGQFQYHKFVLALGRSEIVVSMGGVGAARDSASFSSLLK